ncbi:hypothetical protein PI124_g12779 [Phytophthora idaei]|nr:hypothetical protein PI125_g19743 [Phytophthora idaei]KAG3242379.1 hypothetical protein PI124_g12779 [Phytophthora idaei]
MEGDRMHDADDRIAHDDLHSGQCGTGVFTLERQQ